MTASPATSVSSQLLHDLRSPLNQIIGYSETLTEDADVQHDAHLVNDQQTLRAAVHQILALI